MLLHISGLSALLCLLADTLHARVQRHAYLPIVTKALEADASPSMTLNMHNTPQVDLQQYPVCIMSSLAPVLLIGGQDEPSNKTDLNKMANWRDSGGMRGRGARWRRFGKGAWIIGVLDTAKVDEMICERSRYDTSFGCVLIEFLLVGCIERIL